DNALLTNHAYFVSRSSASPIDHRVRLPARQANSPPSIIGRREPPPLPHPGAALLPSSQRPPPFGPWAPRALRVPPCSPRPLQLAQPVAVGGRVIPCDIVDGTVFGPGPGIGDRGHLANPSEFGDRHFARRDGEVVIDPDCGSSDPQTPRDLTRRDQHHGLAL